MPSSPVTVFPLSPLPFFCSQALEIPDTAVFSLAAASQQSPAAKPCSVPYWDLLQPSGEGSAELPLPRRHVLLSALPRPGAALAAWSLPAPVASDFPRQSLSVPGEPDSGGGPSSRWVQRSVSRPLAATAHLAAGYQTAGWCGT